MKAECSQNRNFCLLWICHSLEQFFTVNNISSSSWSTSVDSLATLILSKEILATCALGLIVREPFPIDKLLSDNWDSSSLLENWYYPRYFRTLLVQQLLLNSLRQLWSFNNWMWLSWSSCYLFLSALTVNMQTAYPSVGAAFSLWKHCKHF